MQSLGKAVTRSTSVGSSLPTIYGSMQQRKITFRRGATSMIAGPPGSYKSTLALNLLVGWAEKGKSALYVSADSDEFTVGKRVAAIATGDKVSVVEKHLRKGAYSDVLNMPRVRFVFTPLDIRGLDRNLRAYEAVYGSFPDVIFIDNLTNAIDSGGEEWGAMRQMAKDLDTISRASQSHVCILHHSSESWEDQNPPPRWKIQGKVSAIPRLVLTMNAVGSHMMIACVKNTNGPQDPSAKDYDDYIIDTSTMRVRDAQNA